MSDELLRKSIDMIFQYDTIPLRVLGTFDEPLFIANDVCDILGIVNSRQAIKNIPEQWKRLDQIETNGGKQEMNLITEHGLYFIVMRSNKPVARPFQIWLCEEVIPSLRKSGSYKMNDDYQKLLREVELSKKALQEKDKVIEQKEKVIEQKEKIIEQKEKLIENKNNTITSNSEVIESLQQKFQDKHDYRFKELPKGRDKKMTAYINMDIDRREARERLGKLRFEARCFTRHGKLDDLERVTQEIAIITDRFGDL